MLMATLQKQFLGVALATALLLLVPAVATGFTAEVSRGPGDFILAGILLSGAGAAMVIVHRYGASRRSHLYHCFLCRRRLG